MVDKLPGLHEESVREKVECGGEGEGRQKSLHGKLNLPVQVKVLFGVSNSRSPARLQRAQKLNCTSPRGGDTICCKSHAIELEGGRSLGMIDMPCQHVFP